MFCPAAFLLAPILSKKNQGVTQEQGMPWADRKYQTLKGDFFSAILSKNLKLSSDSYRHVHVNEEQTWN